MAHAHSGRDITTPLRTRQGRELLDAALNGCKLCRWRGCRAVADSTIGDLYTHWALHRVQSARAEGARLAGTFSLVHVTGNGGRLVYPPTKGTYPLCAVTVEGPQVEVDTSAVMEYVAGLSTRERAWVVDDLLDGLVGAEAYPRTKIEGFLRALPRPALR